MQKSNPMFDIQDSGNVTLRRNSTSADVLLKAEGVGDVESEDNKAGVTQDEADEGKALRYSRPVLAWVFGLLGALLVAFLAYKFGWS